MTIERNKVVVRDSNRRAPSDPSAAASLQLACTTCRRHRRHLTHLASAGLRQWNRVCKVWLRSRCIPAKLPMHGGAAAAGLGHQPASGRRRARGVAALQAGASPLAFAAASAPCHAAPGCRVWMYAAGQQRWSAVLLCCLPTCSTHCSPCLASPPPAPLQPLYVGAEAAAIEDEAVVRAHEVGVGERHLVIEGARGEELPARVVDAHAKGRG